MNIKINVPENITKNCNASGHFFRDISIMYQKVRETSSCELYKFTLLYKHIPKNINEYGVNLLPRLTSLYKHEDQCAKNCINAMGICGASGSLRPSIMYQKIKEQTPCELIMPLDGSLQT
jgi:hypothetical protein